MTEKEENYSYLGDGVYAFFDGYQIWLRTGHHKESKCDNQIFIEPKVFLKLNKFVNKLRNKGAFV